MEYGITFPRGGMAEQPSPWKYLTNFAREAAQMGCAYGVVGDRLESGLDSFSILTVIAAASGRMRLTTSVAILPPRGILVTTPTPEDAWIGGKRLLAQEYVKEVSHG